MTTELVNLPAALLRFEFQKIISLPLGGFPSHHLVPTKETQLKESLRRAAFNAFRREGQRVTLLAACPGGNILELAVAEVIDTDLVPFANDLIGGLSDHRARFIAIHHASKCSAPVDVLAKPTCALFS